jgi:hypothetical protein
MENLPGAIFINICEFLSFKEIFLILGSLSKSFLETTQSFYLCRQLVKRKLELSFFPVISLKQAKSILETIIAKPANKLEFFGFATSGGVDENEMEFWCENLFREDGEAYCAHEDSNGCVAVGVLLDSLCDPRSYFKSAEDVWSILEKYSKEEQIDVFTLISLDKALKFFNFYSQKPELKEKIENEKEIPELSFHDVKRFQDNELMLMHKISIKHSDDSGFFAVLKGLKVNRAGAYTCPVKTLMVFISENFVDVNDPAFKLYDGCRSYKKLKGIVNKEDLPSVEYVSIRQTVEYCEFSPSAEFNVKPVVWVKFRACSKIRIDLQNRFCGKYVYVKLLCAEDNREDLNDGINIDCKYVIPFGNIINLGKEI